MPVLALPLGLLFVAIAAATPAAAPVLSPASFIDVRRIVTPTMPALTLSPDGQLVAYVVVQPEEKDAESGVGNGYTRTGMLDQADGAVLSVTSVATGETRRVTAPGHSAYGAVWSPDGTRLAFYYDANGYTAIWTWTRATGRLRQLSTARARPSDTYTLYWTPDSRHVLVRLVPLDEPDASSRAAAPSAITPSTGKPALNLTVYTFDPKTAAAPDTPAEVARRASWYLCDLAFIAIETGRVHRVARRVTPRVFWLSPDGRRIAWTVPRGSDAGDTYKPLFDLLVTERDGGEVRTVAPRIRLPAFGNVSWSPDSRTLAFVASESLRRATGQVADGQCYLVPADGSGPPRRATDAPHPDFSHTYRPPLWSQDGTRIFALGDNAVWAISLAARRADRIAAIPGRTIVHMVTPRETGRAWAPHASQAGDRATAVAVWTRDVASRDEGLYRVEVETGQVARLWEGPKYAAPNHILDCDAIDAPSTLVCIAEDFQHAPDVWLVSAAHESMRRLSTINPQLTLTDVGTTRVIDWRNGHGEQVRGLLALPPASAGAGPYPLLVASYPRRRFSDLVNAFETRAGLPVQLLTSRGYAVLCADTPVNSTDLAGGVATAVLPGITRVIEMGLADPARVGVFGESGGGYDVMVLITRSSIFKAAVSLSGFADLMAFYGSFREPHQHFAIGWSELFLGGTPWTVPERYVDSSPIYALDRVQAPLLLVHGGADTGVEPHLANQVFIGLKRLGKPVTYVAYHDEGHALRPQARLDFIQRALAWFDQHLKPTPGAVPVPTGQAWRATPLPPH